MGFWLWLLVFNLIMFVFNWVCYTLHPEPVALIAGFIHFVLILDCVREDKRQREGKDK